MARVKKKVIKRGTVNRRLDVLCRKVFVAQRQNHQGLIMCDKCGRQFPYGKVGINLAHIEKRAKKAITWDPLNHLALCNGPGTNNCHHWFDNNKVGPGEWLKENFPTSYDYLREEVDGKPRNQLLSQATIPDLLEMEQKLKEQLGSTPQN